MGHLMHFIRLGRNKKQCESLILQRFVLLCDFRFWEYSFLLFCSNKITRMSKYRFSDSEKYAIYEVLGPKCIWCNFPIAYRDCEIDHIIPERTSTNELQKIKLHYKLHSEFKINSFYNWAPIHSFCNKSKSSKTFELAPFIGALLHKIDKAVLKVEKKKKEMDEFFASAPTIALIENAIKNKIITRDLVNDLLIKNIPTLNPTAIYKAVNCKTETVTENGKYGSKKPKQFYQVSYEQFISTNKSLIELNCIIKADAIQHLMSARENYFNHLKDFSDNDYDSEIDSREEFWMHFALVTKNFVSYTSTTSFYHSGAAHGQYVIAGNNFYIDKLRRFDLSNLLNDSFTFYKVITPLAYNKMIKEIQANAPEVEISDEFPIEKEWLKPEQKTFENYHFTETGLVFIFNPYEISAWSFGAHFPEFKYEELKLHFPQEDRLLDFIKSLVNK